MRLLIELEVADNEVQEGIKAAQTFCPDLPAPDLQQIESC